MKRIDAQKDYLLTVAEEINLMTGLEIIETHDRVFIDTIAGRCEVRRTFGFLMEDVYRFIYGYGMKLHDYGLKKRIELNRKR